MNKYEKYLNRQGYSQNTIKVYIKSVEGYLSIFDVFNSRNLKAYKEHLVDNYKVSTINCRITGLNCYLDYIKYRGGRIKNIKTSKRFFLENVISNDEYKYFTKCLYDDYAYKWYFIVKFIALTGARISELVEFSYKHLRDGYLDIYAKGGKIRRIFIPKILIEEYSDHERINNKEGYLFRNKSGGKLTTRGIALQLKIYAKKYNMNAKVVYPHSFRHLYAKNFIANFKDIALLADLLGHSSIETTRIYLRRSSEEQYEIINKVVNW